MSKVLASISINILSAVAMSACVESHDGQQRSAAAQAEELHVTVQAHADPAHGLRWELGWGAVFAYDEASGALVRRISLADASFSGARTMCRPDLLVGPSGAVIVSSNVEPVLWRIEPGSFEVHRYDIARDADLEQDFGFGALMWGASEKELYAENAATGTRWRIDLDTSSAIKIGPPANGMRCRWNG